MFHFHDFSQWKTTHEISGSIVKSDSKADIGRYVSLTQERICKVCNFKEVKVNYNKATLDD